MGSSSKKKAAKKADFQKTKLKVGKARPKPNNLTDTSFKSKGGLLLLLSSVSKGKKIDECKAISIAAQSLVTAAPTPNAQFSHHLSLLSSHSDSQRRDSLAYLTSQISSSSLSSPLPVPLSVLLPKISPILLDGSSSVRTQLVKSFHSLSNHPDANLVPHVENLLLYIRAGLTHIAPGIRSSAAEVLNWLLADVRQEVVSCPGGWIKTLKAICVTLHWPVEELNPLSTGQVSSANTKAGGSKTTTSTTTTTRPGATAGGGWTQTTTSTTTITNLPALLNVLIHFLRVGLLPAPPSPSPSDSLQPPGPLFPYDLTRRHLLPKRSNAFRHLNLFGAPRDAEGQGYEDMTERRQAFRSLGYEDAVRKGVDGCRRAGGELGRKAGELNKILEEGMRDVE